MPKKDGTGPKGKGAMTGFGGGKCIIPLNTTQEEMAFLENQRKVLSTQLKQIKTRIGVLKEVDQKK